LLIGFGYGSARVLLPNLATWAGTAHSAWVELLLAVGVLGPLLLAFDLLFLIRYALSRASLVPASLILSILTLLVATSITGEGLAFPSLVFAMFAFLHVPVLVQRNSRLRLLRTLGDSSLRDALVHEVHGSSVPNTGQEHSLL
jgi:hypothetical protein